MRTIALIGAPGAGKSTVSLAIRTSQPSARSFAVRLFYRSLHEQGNPLAHAINAALASEPLIPDAMVEDMFRLFLLPIPPATLVLLEGFPISGGQCDAARRQLAHKDRQVDGVVVLSAPRDVLLARIRLRRVCPACERASTAGVPVGLDLDRCPRCGGDLVRRDDDQPDHFDFRYRAHLDEIATVLDGFRDARRLEVDARLSPDQVMAHVSAFLERPA